MKKVDSTLFMAFASGSESKDSVRRLYKGVAPAFVLAVNPTKAEIEKLFNTELEEAPKYISETEVGPEGNKVKTPQVRITFVLLTDVEKCGVEVKVNVPYFLTKAYRFSKDGTKVEVINKYGETAWLPVEHAKAGTTPDNMKWFDTSDMRPAYIGEAALTGFMKAYLNIPNKSFTKDGETKFIKNLADAEARLDQIDKYFTGDFSELRNVIALQPKNKVKGAFGVRTTDDNKQYQAFYTDKVLKNIITDFSKLDEDIKNRQTAGSYPNVEFSTEPLHEYVVESTNFNSAPVAQTDSQAKGLPWNQDWNPNK